MSQQQQGQQAMAVEIITATSVRLEGQAVNRKGHGFSDLQR
jgi:hypothetical protein